MGRRKRRPFRVCASYDTETANIQLGATPDTTRAFPVLFIWHDLRECELASYTPGTYPIDFMRTDAEVLALVAEYIEWGEQQECVPVVCAYNQLFDLQPLLASLNARYEMRANAQSSTHAYTVDIVDDSENVLLRFWDTYYLEMGGLAAMGRTCGLAKADDWDYSLVRTPETPLTADELHYAGRDVEVIPAYLRYLLEANEWLTPDMFGNSVLTKTSLVRQMAKRETGRIRVRRKGRKPVSVQAMFEALCKQEMAPSYGQYALRKACFRGGWTFTAAQYAGSVQRNVLSLDETSAHHAYINGHMVPVKFRPKRRRQLQILCERVVNTPMSQVLRSYHEPFGVALHARIRFTNLRPKAGTAFDAWGIQLLAEGKFKKRAGESEWGSDNGQTAEDATRAASWVDRAQGAVFAFGKLVSARVAVVHVSELELWLMSRVYEWDAMEALLGEATQSFVKPPDYVTLLSNLLFERKQDMKRIYRTYHEGEPYASAIPSSIPGGIAERLRAGTMRDSDVSAYYNSTVKGSFNSIYGTQAQDVFKPSFKVTGGAIEVDPATVVSAENYAEALAEKSGSLVLYTYGLRIVGGSRMPLAIALELLYSAFGDSVRVLGGDTDSIKIACAPDINGDDVLEALQPLHEAVTRSIAECQTRVRTLYPQIASELGGVGTFEVEGDAYPLHMDAWNKARVSYDGKGVHITCAGLSRPAGMYTIESWFSDMISQGWGFEQLAPLALGWGVRVTNAVCHHLEHHRPKQGERFVADVTDHTGATHHVDAPQSIALYASDRVLGDPMQHTNDHCIRYLRSIGRAPDTTERIIDVVDGRAVLMRLTEEGWEEMRPYEAQ